MIELNVNAGAGYKVLICRGLLNDVAKHIEGALGNRCRLLVISDSNVAPIYLDRVLKLLKDGGFKVDCAVLEAGERSKSFATYETLLSAASEAKLTRKDAIVALGGGVVGDIAGFVAATYMRGIRVIQLPTTLLSGIDSSIGGKTGIDTKFGKNTVGCFHQPSLVLFDTDTLDTLPPDQFLNGLGEGLKYAVLAGGEIMSILKAGLDKNNIVDFCALCAQYKADVVEQDVHDNCTRQLLNLGHTVGHAIELLSGYNVGHGVAVAKGLSLMAVSATRHGKLKVQDCEEIKGMIDKYGFDDSIPYAVERIAAAVTHDKKADGKNGLTIVDITGIGRCKLRNMTFAEFEEYLK